MRRIALGLERCLPQPERDWAAGPRKKIPGLVALAAARSLNVVPRRAGRTVEGAVLVGCGALGDQLRMLNVLTRFRMPALRVVANRESSSAFSLYGLDVEADFDRHGVGSLGSSARGLAATERCAVALVPHPSLTQPVAIAIGRARAANVLAAMTGEYRCVARDTTFVTGERTTWQRFYETFFAEAFGSSPVRGWPAPAPAFRRKAGARQLAAVHLMSSDARRACDVPDARRLVRILVERGFRPILLGAAHERAALDAIAAGFSADVVAGAPLRDVGGIMAESSLFFGVDSSMMHLADAIGVPSVVCYTTTTRDVAGPFSTASREIVLAEPTVRDVTILMGRRLRPHPPDWGVAVRRLAYELDELARTAEPEALSGTPMERTA